MRLKFFTRLWGWGNHPVVLLLALLLLALPAAAAITTYQIRGNAVAGANDITAVATGIERLVRDNYPGGNAAMIAQCPNGLIYYAINGGAGASALYRFNPQTPELAPVLLTANSGTGDAFRMVCSAAGVLYVIPDTGVVWTINTTTGIGTAGPTISGVGAGGDATFDSSGQLWIMNSSRRVYRANIAGGAATAWCTATFPGGVTPATLGFSFPGVSTTTAWMLAQQGGGLANSSVYQFTLPVAALGAGACGAAATLVTTVAGSTSTGDLSAIDVAAPNVTVSKADGVTTYVPGGTSTYIVTITNNSAYPVTYTVTDNQPANVTFGTWTCNAAAGSLCGPSGTADFVTSTNTGSGNTITGTRVRLAASGGSATYTIPVTYAVGATGAITNTASVAVAAWLPAPTGTPSASDTNVVRPSAAKTFGAASNIDGGSTTLVFTLTNSTGNPAQSAITLGDTLPTGLLLNSATPAVTYSAGCSGPATAVYTAGTRVLSGLTGIAITAGTASCTITVAGVTNQPGQVNASCAATPAAFTNLATSVTTTNVTNTSVNRCLVVNTTPPTLSKSFAPAAINAGGVSTLTITLSNPNSVAATLTAVLTDSLPVGLVVAATPNAATTCSGAGAVTAAAGSSTVTLPATRSIPAGSNATPSICTVTVDVTASAGGAYTNTLAAGALQTSNGNNVAAAVATLTVSTVAPTIAKSFSPATIPVNGRSTLTFTLSNTNPTPLTGIDFTDTYPAGLVNATPLTVGGTCAGVTHTAAAGGNTFNVTGGTVPPGSCTITVVVTSGALGTYNNTTSGVLTAQTLVRGGPSNTAALTVSANSLSVSKSVTTLCDPHNFIVNPKAIPGAYVRYQITISNAVGAANPVSLTSIGDALDLNLNFDADLRTGSAVACATSAPESAPGRGFRLSCAGGTRACNTPVFFTSAADADAVGISGSNITLTFGDGPAGTKALPTEAGYAPGELKPGESVTIRFNAIVR